MLWSGNTVCCGLYVVWEYCMLWSGNTVSCGLGILYLVVWEYCVLWSVCAIRNEKKCRIENIKNVRNVRNNRLISMRYLRVCDGV